MDTQTTKIEVEFTLALNCRTGRFFVCRDMMQDTTDLIGTVRYWRVSSPETPQGLYARVLGKLAAYECRARVSFPTFDRLVPRMRRRAPVVFTDPLQTLLYQLKPQDLVICYDMGPVTHPEVYAPGVQSLYRKAFNETKTVRPHVIFISETSKREYDTLYGPSYRSGQVVYPAIRTEITDGPCQPLPNVKPPFLLTVGSLSTRKNQLRAIQAFQLSGLQSKGFSYIISGGNEPGHEKIIELAAATHSVYTTGYVSEPQLRWLYANASGFVLPSLLEGFGFPAAEAVVRGLVPLVSREGALREVTGDAAILVDPLDLHSIAEGMITLTTLTKEAQDHRLSLMRNHLAKINPEAARQGWRTAFENAIKDRDFVPQVHTAEA